LMAKELGWSKDRERRELESYAREVAQSRRCLGEG